MVRPSWRSQKQGGDVTPVNLALCGKEVEENDFVFSLSLSTTNWHLPWALASYLYREIKLCTAAAADF